MVSGLFKPHGYFIDKHTHYSLTHTNFNEIFPLSSVNSLISPRDYCNKDKMQYLGHVLKLNEKDIIYFNDCDINLKQYVQNNLNTIAALLEKERLYIYPDNTVAFAKARHSITHSFSDDDYIHWVKEEYFKQKQ